MDIEKLMKYRIWTEQEVAEYLRVSIQYCRDQFRHVPGGLPGLTRGPRGQGIDLRKAAPITIGNRRRYERDKIIALARGEL